MRLVRRALVLLLASGTSVAAAQTYHLRPERARRPLEISVQPGDLVRLDAGGCFRASDGSTRPLLQPDREAEQGLIFIPGVTMSFAPLADLIGRDLAVPAKLDYPGPPRIWLDWGSYYRSPLETGAPTSPPLPCLTPDREPWLDLRITHGAVGKPPAAGPLDLVLSRYDRNLLPLNPAWVGGGQPDPCSACDGFRLESRADGSRFIPALREERCTSQRPYVDSGGCRPRWGDCPGRAKRLSGHVDWGPATYTGSISTWYGGPVHVSRDGDANFLLATEGGGGVVTQADGSVYAGTIGVEFSTTETIRIFETPWWRLFPFRRENYRPIATVFKKLQRHPGARGPAPSLTGRHGAVIGLFNIDTVHPHTELHPAWAVAVQTEANRLREVWQVFARDWGTGGDCGGRLDHRIDLRRVVLPLPGGKGRAFSSAEGDFRDHGAAFGAWRVHAGGGEPALVIEIPPDRPCAVVEGQLILKRGHAPQTDSRHLARSEPPVGEPVRLEARVGADQLCGEP